MWQQLTPKHEVSRVRASQRAAVVWAVGGGQRLFSTKREASVCGRVYFVGWGLEAGAVVAIFVNM